MNTQAKYQGKIPLSQLFPKWEKGAGFPFSLEGIKRRKAFTLTEIIVVITILAILGLIAFVSIQGYVVEARDVKRLTDIRSLYGKIMLKHSLGDLLANFQDYKLSTGVIINGEENKISNIGTINFLNLKETSDSFKNPSGKPYLYAYSQDIITIGGIKEAYSFVQLKTESEKEGKDVIIGNYFKYDSVKDSDNLFNSENVIIEDDSNGGESSGGNGGENGNNEGNGNENNGGDEGNNNGNENGNNEGNNNNEGNEEENNNGNGTDKSCKFDNGSLIEGCKFNS